MQLYMALGGILHYLKEIKKGESTSQNINRICFEKKGLLVNEFDNLYLKFMRNKKSVNWRQLDATATYKTWSDYAFENVCMKHINKIMTALNIASVYTESSSFFYKAGSTTKGAPIDLLTDRNDVIINICDAKFYDKAFTVPKSYADELRNKMLVFQKKTNIKKTLFITIISIDGVVQNIHCVGFVQQQATIENLF